jgi:hypothetical protein
LCGISVEQDVPRASQRGHLGEGLQRADLVVGVHHGDQDGVRTYGLFEVGRIE